MMDTTQPQKEWKNAFCSNRNGPQNCHTKLSQTEKEKSLVYMWNLKKNNKNELIYKTETDTQT